MMLLDDVRPVERTTSAVDRQKRREQLRALLNALQRIQRSETLLTSVIHEHRYTRDQRRHLAAFKAALKVVVLAAKRSLSFTLLVPRFNPRERQWLDLLHLVFDSTGKY
jgi:hypothetical protein